MPAIMMATDPGGGRPFNGESQFHPHHNMMQPQPQPDLAKLRKIQDHENLRNMLIAWNANRLDLFELSMPNEDLEFHGVMRFYYQNPDPGSGQKVATKCIRVSSTANAKQIIETLIEKFRPDMKMLEVPEYALYEIHESGERRIGLNEKPLLVQLSWHHDDREGRFLLRRIDEASHMPTPTQEDSSFKRKLSKREKKELKKQEKKEKVKDGKADESVADKLYTELPDTSFTRSISNPEAVMRRRRQQKLEKKLQQFRSKDGGPDTGGTLKIYGDSLRKDVPYKTLLLSVRETAGQVVSEMLEKYGIDKREAPNFCLVQSNLSMPDDGGEGHVVGGGTTREYILEEDECPLNILMNHQSNKGGAITFHVKRRPMDKQIRRKKERKMMAESLPFLLELTPDGGDRIVRLQMSVTEIGTEVGVGGVRLPGLLPRHCLIAHTEGAVTVTPSSPQAEVIVNNQRATETTILQHGSVVKLANTVWRFLDPASMENPRLSQATLPNMSIHGSTATLPGQEHFQDGMRSTSSNYVSFSAGQNRGKDAILPAVLEFREETERGFFNALTFGLDPSTINFKLAPTYTIYMATRFRASTHYKPELVPEERAVRLTDMLNRLAAMILAVIQQSPAPHQAPTLSFWMANASELLHFLKSDRHITAFSLQAQDVLADAVHFAFKQLVISLQADLEVALPNFLSENDGEADQSTNGIISVFSSAMGLLRKCRVNAALTIQLFSQLFHFVNMWSFNAIVTDQQFGPRRINYCTHTWGLRIKRRLAKVEIWAEKQGLELAADCHLARITQAAHLLQASKSTPEDIATLSSTCFKLNSLQLETLLSRYQPAEHEAPISKELIQTIVRVARNTVDQLTEKEGRQVRLEEDFVLQLPFLLPEDNYSCDIIRGVPGGLVEFINPLQRHGLCFMTPQPTSSGFWTIYLDTPPPLTPAPRSPSEVSQATFNPGEMNMTDVRQVGPGGHQDLGEPHDQPEILTIRLSKTNGMGLSIVAAKGNRNEKLGIYIKAVVEGGAAWQDGRLEAGDHLLAVDGNSLVGITQERAAQLMMSTGPVVTLQVAKQGAFFHGLDQLLSQPSPVTTRHNSEQQLSQQDRRKLGHPGPHTGPQPQQGPPPVLPSRIAQSKSAPSLHQELPPNDFQHNYQNQEWLHTQMAPRNLPPGAGSRSSSVQNIPGPGVRPILSNQDVGGFYQNLHPPEATAMKQRPRFGSQSSLNGPPMLAGSRPLINHYPGNMTPQHMEHGAMMVRYPGPHVPTPLSSNGPEKPQRQFSYEMEPHPSQRPETERLSQNRVRFQDPQEEPVISNKRNGHPTIEENPGESSSALHNMTASPPPLPNSPPPMETPPPPAPGTHRLDMLLGNTKPKAEATTRSKKVSFMAEEVSVSKFEYNDEDLDEVTETDDEQDKNENDFKQENLEKMQEDPNVFLNEAENLLAGGLGKIELSSVSTGHTPSVIGTQEVYRDPRSRMLLEQQERKLSGPKPTDGSKLSFQEKMKLFAQEAGETTPRDKAKISKAQREIDQEAN